MDHMAVHVGQSSIDAVVVRRKLRVIDAEQVQGGRVPGGAEGRILRRLEVELSPFEFLDRLADLVPPPSG